MKTSPWIRTAVRGGWALVAWACAVTWVCATPVTGWLRDTSFGGGSGASLTNANTNSPIMGSGAPDNADNVAIYAPMPLVSLEKGQQIILTGSAEMIGTASTPDFRWGLFEDDGAGSATAGWLGYMGSAESNVWSKDPAGQNFATTTFASVAGSPARGFLLGSMPEPNAIPFNPGNYDFRMTVRRFDDDAAEVQVAIRNDLTGFSITTPFYTESNPSRLTFDFDRVGFLAGSALDADQVRFSAIDVAVAPITAPTLRVYSSGLAFLTNQMSATFDLTYYDVTSESGALNPATWLSLDDQENDDPLGVGWEEAGGSSENVLGEVNLVGTTSLSQGSSLRLGAAFVPGSDEDLIFRYTAGQGVERGLVEYLQTGDYNRDGFVNIADYVVWRNSHGRLVPFGSGADGDGDGVIGQGDLAEWSANFGAVVSPGGGSAAAVPEPQMLAILMPAIIALLNACRGSKLHDGIAGARIELGGSV